MEQCWDANPSQRPNSCILYNKINEIYLQFQNLSNDSNESNEKNIFSIIEVADYLQVKFINLKIFLNYRYYINLIILSFSLVDDFNNSSNKKIILKTSNNFLKLNNLNL